MVKERLVDMFTHDRNLDDIMLREHPPIFKPDEQYDVQTDSDGKTFSFFGFNWQELEPFLREKAPLLAYEIHDSKTGAIVKVNGVVNA